MFSCTKPFLLFDYFRVPYRLAGSGGRVAHLRLAEHEPGAAALHWVASDSASLREDLLPLAQLRFGSILVYARLLPDDAAQGLLDELGGSWTPWRAVVDARGQRVGSVWRDDRGSVFLPFDPCEAVRNVWSEAYVRDSPRGKMTTAARRVYYRVRPIVPRGAQIRLRRAFTSIQKRVKFPRWPAEPALHDFYGWLFDVVTAVSGRPVPTLAPWPNGHSWALVLTHDVETDVGLANLEAVRQLELDADVRSSWNLVPRRYEVDDALVGELSAEGFEVGVHGLYHDGLDLDSEAHFAARLPEMRAARDRWRARGFRAPALHRRWEWMDRLGFDYDSSYPDTDPYEPQSGGCCSWLPFFIGDTVELPVTLPQDHTLFAILRHADEALWVEKASFLRDRGGMALLITHPDYLVSAPVLAAYERFLEAFARDETAWKPLPRELAAWWRRRAASRPELVDGTWTVVGPAAGEATVVLAQPNGAAA
ncbi:MAG TPA: hypothetical protein VF236_01125 [Gaiellaceae bacterium]